MYTFSFDSFQITDTRSPHKDTDYASLSLAVGSALGAPDGEIGGLLFANCDGPVAAGVHVFTAAERREIISATDHNPGPASPHGCGSNSNYYVTRSTRSA